MAVLVTEREHTEALTGVISDTNCTRAYQIACSPLHPGNPTLPPTLVSHLLGAETSHKMLLYAIRAAFLHFQGSPETH